MMYNIAEKNAIYLVVNPSIGKEILLDKIKQALEGGVNILQIWSNWPLTFTFFDKDELAKEIKKLADRFNVPVLINEEWRLIKSAGLAGVHFDHIPEDFGLIKKIIYRKIITGITCGNDLATVKWAAENKVDYISFCSMFPSGSVSTCEIVDHQIVKQARLLADMPIFLAGGIAENNLTALRELDFDGIAVISGVLSAESPKEAIKTYKQALNKLKP